MSRAARIAVCEPHPELRALLLRTLEHLGHTPVSCRAAGAHGGEIDALILNPKDGPMLEWARALRQESPELPIVYVSTLAPDDSALELGPVAAITKPFRIAELERAVESALALARAAA